MPTTAQGDHLAFALVYVALGVNIFRLAGNEIGAIFTSSNGKFGAQGTPPEIWDIFDDSIESLRNFGKMAYDTDSDVGIRGCTGQVASVGEAGFTDAA